MKSIHEQFLLYRIRTYKDSKAFEEIYQKNVVALRRFLRTKLPSEADADDAVTTTFLRLWNYLITTEVEHISGLLFTIARGVVAEFYRAKKFETVSIDVAIEMGQEPATKDGAGVMHQKTEVSLVRQAMDEMTDEQRAVIAWRYFEDLPLSDIAKRLQKTSGATRVSLHRALKILKTFFTES